MISPQVERGVDIIGFEGKKNVSGLYNYLQVIPNLLKVWDKMIVSIGYY